MVDDIDRAQAREQLDRDLALAAMRERIDASLVPSIDGQCIDCDSEIEPARVAALHGRCSRCITCATRHERRLKECRA